MKSQALDLGGYTKHSITLINELGNISIYLPNALDTFYTYADFGEYRCGETKQFRFASKKFDPDHATDFSYSDPTDTLYQLTIIQTYAKDCETYVTIDDAMLKSMKKEKGKIYSILDAKGKKIIAGVYETKKGNMDIAEIDAITTVSGRQVKFIFQCFRKYAKGFVDQMMTSLKTLEIKENSTSKS